MSGGPHPPDTAGLRDLKLLAAVALVVLVAGALAGDTWAQAPRTTR